MGFRKNLIQKIRIDRLTDEIIRSTGAAGSGQRVNLEAMRQLIELGAYAHQRERDLDLYMMAPAENRPRILLLDNELKIYATSPEDIALRKSPTVKEMVSIRNAIKILNDKDVVVSRKADTVHLVQAELIAGLDLSYTAADIEALARDGREALENNYADGMIEILDLLAELLAWRQAPKVFQAAHHKIWGRVVRQEGGEIELGPAVLLNLMQNSLKMVKSKAASRNKAAMDRFHQVAKGEKAADSEGPEVFTHLKEAVLAKGA